MIEVNYGELGFMKDAAYSAHFWLIVQKYDGQFEGAESVVVEIKEATLYDLQYNRDPWLVVSDDRKNVRIKFSAQKYYGTNGKVTSIPAPESVFQDLHNLMKRAVQRYNSKEI